MDITLELERGHEYYDKQEYYLAIKHYKEALSYAEIPAKINLAGFDSNYFLTLETIQKIWGWLGLAYREIDSDKEATKCIEKEEYFAQLVQVYSKDHQTRKKEFYREIVVIIVIELVLLIAGSIAFVFLSANPILVNFLCFIIDFTIFFIFLVKIRYTYKRNIKKENFLTIKGLSQFAKRRTPIEIFTDPFFTNGISFGFWMVIVSLIFLWDFIYLLSGTSLGGWDSLFNRFGFHPAYIALTFLGLFFDRFLFSVYEEIVQTHK